MSYYKNYERNEGSQIEKVVEIIIIEKMYYLINYEFWKFNNALSTKCDIIKYINGNK